MKTLAILAQKGGSGKTTLAVHMAVCAERSGLRTAILDVDPQGSAAQWNQSRPDGMKLSATRAEASQLAGLLDTARARGIDLAIIDTAPHSNSAAAIVAGLADLVLIPCRPARFDLDAIASTLDITRAARVPAAVVINAAPRGKLAEEARQALLRQGVNVVGPVLHQRAAYSHAVIDGRSVHEYEPKGAAAAEIEALYHHITGLYGDTKRKKRGAA